MKTIILSILLLSNAAHAITYAECQGSSAQDTLHFFMRSRHEVVLTHVSDSLVEYGGSILEEDEAAYLPVDSKYKNDKVELYSMWDGNWGYDIRLPKTIVNDSVQAGQTFKMVYHFVYNDIAESDFYKTLKCTIK